VLFGRNRHFGNRSSPVDCVNGVIKQGTWTCLVLHRDIKLKPVLGSCVGGSRAHKFDTTKPSESRKVARRKMKGIVRINNGSLKGGLIEGSQTGHVLLERRKFQRNGQLRFLRIILLAAFVRLYFHHLFDLCQMFQLF